MSGFIINKLMVTGPNVKPAFVDFKKGLNIITGPSDSGKTFIFECINFMLGSSEKPKEIPEGKGYETVFLELNTGSEIVTLERKLKGGNISIYIGNTTELKGIIPKTLAESHKAGSIDNISGYLLNLSGFKNPSWIKRNVNNKKSSLSFRNLKNFTMIREERIISKSSPIHSGQHTDATLDKSLMKLILTGEDDSKLDEIEKPEIKKAKMFAKLEILDEMIETTKNELAKFKPNGKKHSETDLQLEYLMGEFNNENQNIDIRNSERKKVWEEIKLNESRAIVINELLVRFNLLEMQYNADIKRLEFINEGSHYFSQLNEVKCPFCGTSIEEDKCRKRSTYDAESINTSCLVEINKIQLNIRDLNKSRSNLRFEFKEIDQSIQKNRENNERIETEINEVLQPKSEEIKNKIEEILSEQQRIFEEHTINEKLNDFIILHETISRQKKPGKAKKTETIDIIKLINESNFPEYIAVVLKKWKFNGLKEVDIKIEEVLIGKTKLFDLYISGKLRSDFGKGYRAILYSAFVIALISFCKDKSLPHPGFVILDSPVTTFKEAKQTTKVDEEIIPSSIQTSFFEDLSKNYKDTQIIILENKVPPNSIKGNINLIEFTKDPDRGRFGFYDVHKQ